MAETVTKLPAAPERLPVTFQLQDGRLIEGATIRPLSFASFVTCAVEAQTMTQPKSFEARLRRQRLLRQIQFYSGGTPAVLSQEDLLQMPIAVARQLINKMDDEGDAKPGKVIRPGDGVDQAIVFELGVPLPGGQGKPPIKELEFLARNYGDVEDILAAPDAAQQTKLLVETLAKPLGTSLSVLPSWAVSQLAMVDGFALMREVLPHFLGSPVE